MSSPSSSSSVLKPGAFPLALRAALAGLGILDGAQKEAAAPLPLSLAERTSP